jgi:hypothetical protein
MRNVTIALDEAVADWSRIWAATHQTSVSRMLGELLAEKMAEEERYSAAMEGYLAAPSADLSVQDLPSPAAHSALHPVSHPYPNRDASHER